MAFQVVLNKRKKKGKSNMAYVGLEKFATKASSAIESDCRTWGFTGCRVSNITSRDLGTSKALTIYITLYGGKRKDREYVETLIRADVNDVLHDCTVEGHVFFENFVFNYA